MSLRILLGSSLSSFSSVNNAGPSPVIDQILWNSCTHDGEMDICLWLSEQGRRLILVLLVGLICFGGVAHTQVQPGFPNPRFDPQDCQFGICVNLANNNVTLSAPIRHKAGAFPFQADFLGNYYIIEAGGNGWSPAFGSASAQVNQYINSGAQATYTVATPNVPCNNGTGILTTVLSNWVFYGYGGTVHPLPFGYSTDASYAPGQPACLGNSGFTAVATTDNSGFLVSAASNGWVASNIQAANGSSMTGSVAGGITEIKDVFGNNVQVSGSAFFDTLGVNALSFSGGTQQHGPFKWTDVEGNTQTVTLGVVSEPTKTNFSCSGIPNFPLQNISTVNSITFADQTTESWTFNPTYGYPADTDGRLSKITLPTGGTVQFTYGSAQNNIDCTYWTSDTITKVLGNGDTTTYTLSYTGGTPPTAITNTVINPGKNKTVYTFSGSQLITSIVHYLGSASTTLDTTTYCYNALFSVCSPTSSGSPTLPITEVIVYHKLTGQTNYSATDTKFDGTGNMTYSAQYDVGASSPTWTKTVTYGTCTSNCSSASAGITQLTNILNLPGKIVTTQNGSTVAQSNFAYNSTGRLTQAWVWSGSSFLSQTNANTYNGNGTPATTYDLNNNETTYAYLGGSYSDGCASSNYPFPTSITDSGTGLSSSFTYDCEGGVVLTSSDPNGNATTFAYNAGSTGEPYWRTLSIEDPLGNTKTFTYPNASTPDASSVTVPITSSTTDTVTATVDGYGRPINVQKEQSSTSSHYDTVSKGYLWETSGTYNNYLQVSTSQPCSVTSGTLCTMSHFSYVDPLGRTLVSNTTSNETVTSTFTPTGTTYYVLSALTPVPTGENAKQIQTQYDGLGRVKSVCHIGSTVSTGSGTACPSGSYNGAVDTYTYGQGTGYTTVSVTRGSQTRTTTYDALGRMTQKFTPEGGTWNYYYDTVAGWCAVSGGASTGNLTCTIDPNNNVTIYGYDSLDRLAWTGSGSSGGGVSACTRFFYDNSSGALHSLPTGVTLTNQYGRLVEAETDDCSWPVSSTSIITDEWFAYDKDGRMLNMWESTKHSTQYYQSTATFFANGAVNTLQLASPSKYTITFGLEGEGRLSTVTDTTTSTNLVTGATYYPAANPAVVSLTGSGPDNDAYTFDTNTGNVTQYVFTVGSASMTGVLGWNPNRTLGSLNITDGFNSGGTQTCYSNSSSSLGYGYDDWSRLMTFDCGGGHWGQNFTYDIYDNLTKNVISGRPGTTWAPGYSSLTNECTGCLYDGNGNVTGDGNHVFGWNGFSKMKWSAVSGTPTCGTSGKCITYDAFGRMVEFSSGTTWTQYWLTQAGKISMNGATPNYGYFPAPEGGTVIINANSGSYYYLHKDWLGSARVASNIAAHTVTADQAYTPYGEVYNLFGSSVSKYDQFAGTSSDYSQGVMADTPNRELSVVGRWLSPDPAGMGWNQYAYPTNPNSMSDPSGLDAGGGNGEGSCENGCPISDPGPDPNPPGAGSYCTGYGPCNLPGYYPGGEYGGAGSGCEGGCGTMPASAEATGTGASVLSGQWEVDGGPLMMDPNGNGSSDGELNCNFGGSGCEIWDQSALKGQGEWKRLDEDIANNPANNPMYLAGVLPFGMNGAAIYAKFVTRGAPPTNIFTRQNPVWPQGPEPPIGGRDLEAMDAFEKMMHALIALKENGESMFDTLFIVMPAQEVCSSMNTCGGDGTI